MWKVRDPKKHPNIQLFLLFTPSRLTTANNGLSGVHRVLLALFEFILDVSAKPSASQFINFPAFYVSSRPVPQPTIK